MQAESAGTKKYFWISDFSLIWERDVDGGKAGLRRGHDLP